MDGVDSCMGGMYGCYVWVGGVVWVDGMDRWMVWMVWMGGWCGNEWYGCGWYGMGGMAWIYDWYACMLWVCIKY